MDLREILAVAGAVVTVVTAAAVSRFQVGEHAKRIETMHASLTEHDSRLGLLEQKQEWQSTQIDGLVRDLRSAVTDLQRLAVDLAKVRS